MSFYFPSSSSSCADASRSCSALPTCAERPSAAHFFDMLKQSPVYGHAFLLPPASFLYVCRATKEGILSAKTVIPAFRLFRLLLRVATARRRMGG